MPNRGGLDSANVKVSGGQLISPKVKKHGETIVISVADIWAAELQK
jgi:hypothetical protein